jgi:hypothetical protein
VTRRRLAQETELRLPERLEGRAVPLRQFGRAFDVGEGERHDAGRRRDILGSVYGNDGADSPAARPLGPGQP